MQCIFNSMLNAIFEELLENTIKTYLYYKSTFLQIENGFVNIGIFN